jgi:hypothetical protein
VEGRGLRGEVVGEEGEHFHWAEEALEYGESEGEGLARMDYPLLEEAEEHHAHPAHHAPSLGGTGVVGRGESFVSPAPGWPFRFLRVSRQNRK